MQGTASGLLLFTGTNCASGAADGTFSTTSADYWIGTYDKGFFFSTTSADWWGSTKGYLTSNDGTFSTTSALYFESQFGDWNVVAGSYLTPTTTLGVIFNASSTHTGILNATGGASTTRLTNNGATWLTGLTGPAPIAITSTGLAYAAATTTAGNPTGSVGSASATNGTALTYMRSDAVPACTAATASVPGCLTAANFVTFNGKLNFSDIYDKSTNFGIAVISSSTVPLWTGGIQASSTSQFANASSTNFSYTNAWGTRLNLTNASTTNGSFSQSLFAQGNRVSGERYVAGKISTSTAWTATSSETSVFGDTYRFYFPFTGTISSYYFGTNAGTLTVKVTCGSNSIYVFASSTANLNTTSLSCAKGDLTTVTGGNPASTPKLASFTLIGTGY